MSEQELSGPRVSEQDDTELGLATESATEGVIDDGPDDFFDELLRGYQMMEMEPKRYLNQVLLPVVVVFFATIVISLLLGLPPIRFLPLVALMFFAVVVAFIYPKLAKDRQSNDIEKQFHLFLTHITILAMSDIDRMDVMRALAEEEDYGALQKEMQIVVSLVENWNLSLIEAAKTRSHKTPSRLMENFFDRLAYSLESGQSFDDFLLNEQEKILSTYTTYYEGQLSKLDTIKDLYLAVLMGTTFAMVFVIILPLLAGSDPTVLIGGVAFVYALVQIGFAGFVHVTVPADPLWFITEEHNTMIRSQLRRSIYIAVGGSAVLLVLLTLVKLGFTPLPTFILPIPFIPAIAGTPLLYPYFVGGTEEKKIRQRDEEFPRFIRALGEIEGVRPTSTVQVLENLRDKEFGSLTEHVERLYRRMNLHLDNQKSWELFAAEVSSHLIHKFSDMYASGREMGADPKELSRIIGSNMMDVTSLREKRLQRASSIKGLIYGLLTVGTFSIFAGFEFTQIMVQISAAGDATGVAGGSFDGLLQSGLYDTTMITILLTALIVIGAVAAGVIIRLIERGKLATGTVHIVVLMWTGAIAAYFSKYAAQLISTTIA